MNNEGIVLNVNRFSGSCKPTHPGTKTQSSQKTDRDYVKDIRWDPEERIIYVDKGFKTDLTIDIGSIIPQEPVVDEDIKVVVWNPITGKSDQLVLVEKNTEYTDALQLITAAIGSLTGVPFRNNTQKMIDDQRLKDQASGFFNRWSEWDDKDPQS